MTSTNSVQSRVDKITNKDYLDKVSLTTYRYPMNEQKMAPIYVSVAMGIIIGCCVFTCGVSGGLISAISSIVAVSVALIHTIYLTRILR